VKTKADDTEKITKELESATRKSQRALLPFIAIEITLAVLLLALDIWLNVRWWVYALLLWAGAFTIVMDVINIAYCGSKLRKLRATRRISEGQ